MTNPEKLQDIGPRIMDPLAELDPNSAFETLQRVMVLCMAMVGPENRRKVAQRLERDIPAMLETANQHPAAVGPSSEMH